MLLENSDDKKQHVAVRGWQHMLWMVLLCDEGWPCEVPSQRTNYVQCENLWRWHSALLL